MKDDTATSVEELNQEQGEVKNEGTSPEIASPPSSEETKPEGQPQGETGEKQPSGFARRLHNATQKVAQEYEARISLLEQHIAALTKPEPATKTPEDFSSYTEYDAYIREAERQEIIRQAQLATQQELLQAQITQAYNARLEQAKKQLPDWDKVSQHALNEGLPSELAQKAPALMNALLESEVGPHAVHAIFSDANLYARLLTLPEKQQLRELGRLEERITTKLKAPSSTKTVTTAPRKVEEPKGGTVKPTTTAADRFTSKQAWREWYEGQRSSKR